MSESRLSNGLQILTVEDAHIPKVAVHMGLRIGKVDNPADNSALWPLALDLIREGTESRGSAEMARLLDRSAISFEAESRTEHSFLFLSALRTQMEKGLELLAEMVRFPSFPEREVRRLIKQWKSELRARRALASYVGRERMLKGLFGEHPYARVTLQPSHLESTTRQAIVDFYFGRISPQRSTILLAGAISHSEAVKWVEKSFGDWSSRGGGENQVETPPKAVPSVALVHRPHSQQARLIVAGDTFETGHADEQKYRVANYVLGGGGSARLFLNLREKKGYTYGIYSRGQFLSRSGLTTISADFPSPVIAEAHHEIMAEMSRLALEPPTEQEMESARSALTARLLFQTETPFSRGHLELIRRLYDLPSDYYPSYVEKLQQVTSSDAADMARKYFDPQRFLTVAVGDREELQGQLESLGKVAVFDSEGEEIPA